MQHDPENYRSKYWVHKALKAKAKNLLGLDLSEDGVNYLRTKGFNVEFGDAQDFSLGQSFDVIVAGELIEHLEDFSGFFSCCKAHLRENGKLLISTPNPWYWKNIIMAVLHNEIRVNPEHTCWFCPSTLRSLARRHGFDIKEIEFGSRYLADRLIPLPRGIKHTSWHAVLVISDRLDIIS